MAKGNSWKTRNDHSSSYYRGPRNIARRSLKSDAQFTFEQLYISPFNRRRKYHEDGTVEYVALEKQTAPTGIHVMDDFLRYLAEGKSDMKGFADRHGLKTTEIGAMIFILTGIKGIKFRQMFQMRMVDELLRFTALPFSEVARLSGLGSDYNMYLALRREYNMSATERRNLLQQPNDAGAFDF